MITAQNKARANFLSGAGEMGTRIRSFDWSRTSLGPIENWPESLKTSVSLILGSRHPMWIGWGPEMTFLYNDAYLHVLGAAKHPGALGKPAAEVWAEIWEVCGPLADKVFCSGEATFVDDVRLFMDRGRYLEETFYSFSYSPIRDEAGRVCGLFCPSTDVTPKVVNARRLATLSELASNSLVEKTVAAACGTAARTLRKNGDDIPFALLYLAGAEGLEARLEQAVGDFAPDFAHISRVSLEDDSLPWPIASVYRSAQRQAIDTTGIEGLPRGVAGQPVIEAVVLPVASSGEHKPYGVLVAGVNPGRPLDADHLTFFDLLAGQVGTAIHNARTIEEEKRRADMLAEIDRAKTIFFSNISHEFRTPLTLMLGPMEALLARSDRLPEEDREHLATAHRNSLRLLKLVNSLLDFARLEAGRLKATYSPTDLASFTADLAANFRSAIQVAGLDLIVDCPPLPEPVYVDRQMWEKIVLNLLSNAFKFTFEGFIAIRLRAEDGDAVLTVIDTGIGIPESGLPRIFERFYRVEGARGRTYEGSGIGLALIQEFAKLHGGTITAESRVGEGSKFTVKIPMGKAHLDPARIQEEGTGDPSAAQPFFEEAASWLPRAAEDTCAADQTRPQVLVVDDNADMRQYIQRALGGDYQVSTARDGREALEKMRANPPDLLLSDIMMPVMNGFELLSAVRHDPKLRAIPTIFVSARTGEELRIEGLEAGADDYLVKPFTAPELRARVRSQVRAAILRREATEREAALRAEAEAARDDAIAVLESIAEGFFAIDRDWRVTYVNGKGARLSAIRADQALGRAFWDIFPGWKETAADHEFRRAAQERARAEFESFYVPRNRWFHINAYPAQEQGLSIFIEDITERKQRERASSLLGAIIGSSDDAIITKDLNGVVTSWNQSAERLFGYTAEEAIGKTIEELLIPVDRRAEETYILERLRRGERIDHFETVRHAKDGSLLDVTLTVSPLADASGTIIGASKLARDTTQAKRAERAALHLAAIVDSSDDAIISKDLNGIITSWNKSAERVFGYTAEEAIGQAVITLLVPAGRQDEELEILDRLRRGEHVDHFETIGKHKDGRLLDISLTSSPIKDARGNIIGVSKIARDISDRKRAETAIQNLNAQLTSELLAMARMQQLSTRLVGADDFMQLLADVLDAASEITGAGMGNIQLDEGGVLRIVCSHGFDRQFLELFEGVHPGQAACGRAFKRRERVIVEDVSSSALFDDATRAALLSAGVRAVQSTPLISRSGELLGILSTHYGVPRRPGEREQRLLDILARQAADLIERRRHEIALLESEAKFRQLADAMPQIVWTADAAGRPTYFNERWYEFTGLERDRFDREAWEGILHPEDFKAGAKLWTAAVRKGEPFRAETRLWDRREQRWRWFISRALPVRDAQGRVAKWFGTSTDIDEQKRVEGELRRANQHLEQFAYSASHDLQEPLRSIKIYGELLSRRYGAQLEGQALEFLNYLRTGASQMEVLIRDLLEYTQVTRLEAPDAPADTVESLNASLANLAGAITESGATVTYEPLPPLRVHSTHLRQLFQNLIGNAIKYRHRDRAPLIHVSAEREAGAWVISVKDNGIGIKPEYKEHIFGLFKRLHPGDEYSGTGIGLAICQRIVERYNGRIWVESEAGKGSDFRFSIPA